MVHTTNTRQGYDLRRCRRLRCALPPHWRLFGEPEMGSVLVVVADILMEQPSKMSLAQRHHMSEQLVAAAQYPPLAESILPRASISRRLRFDPHPLDDAEDALSELLVVVVDEIARDLAVGEGFSQLLSDPGRRWVCCVWGRRKSPDWLLLTAWDTLRCAC